MKKLILLILAFYLLGISACIETPDDQWHRTANGIWTYSIGNNEHIDLLEAAGAKPNISRLNELSADTFPIVKDKIEINRHKNGLYLKFPLEKNEQIYGLGLQFKGINRRGKLYHLHVDHYSGKDNGRTHAPVPFFVSSKGYGVLINSERYISVYVGTGNRLDSPNPPVAYDRNTDKNWTARPESDMIEIFIPDDHAEIVVFGGDSPMDAVKRYNLYCGGGCLPPKWGLGLAYRTHTLYSEDQVFEELMNFEKFRFPLDVIGLEPGWMSMSYPCSYEWDKGRFPNPEKFIDSLNKKGIKVNLWMNPYIAEKAGLYKPMLPFAGSHTVWCGIVPDYTMNEARDVFTEFYTETHLDIGVSGLKIDEVDGVDSWLWPDVASFPSGTGSEQMRQIYATLIQSMITDLYHSRNLRTYGLVRGSNAGSSYLPFVIYSDYYNHRDYLTALVNSGFSGVLWTPEVRDAESAEEWLRRIQLVCFSPMAEINAWYSGKKPWSYPDVYEAVREVALLRIQLLPYIYSTFAEYHFNGIPPIRPMPLVEGFRIAGEVKSGLLDDSENPYGLGTKTELRDQFMFGENILVAPMFAGEKSRKVFLPMGKWYDFYTGKYVGENEIIEVVAKLEEIPLFVRDGGIIPMIKPRLRTPASGEKLELEIRHYGKAEGSFLLYDDDGETYDYERGEYSWTILSVKKPGEDQYRGIAQRVQGTEYNYTDISWVYMTK